MNACVCVLIFAPGCFPRQRVMSHLFRFKRFPLAKRVALMPPTPCFQARVFVPPLPSQHACALICVRRCFLLLRDGPAHKIRHHVTQHFLSKIDSLPSCSTLFSGVCVVRAAFVVTTRNATYTTVRMGCAKENLKINEFH